MAKEVLAKCGIPLAAAETGGQRGRTVRLSVGTGDVTVTSVGSEPK